MASSTLASASNASSGGGRTAPIDDPVAASPAPYALAQRANPVGSSTSPPPVDFPTAQAAQAQATQAVQAVQAVQATRALPPVVTSSAADGSTALDGRPLGAAVPPRDANTPAGIDPLAAARPASGLSPAVGPDADPGAPSAATSVVPAVHPSPALREESGRAPTSGGAGFWVQLGAYRQRAGALDFQHRLVDEQPWLAPLLAVFTDNGLNRLQAGPYGTREDARNAAERIRVVLQLVPTIVEKR
ncbi:MAG TPA: SPOR domain-containing protein [Burkholderiaceae bacterium]|nr:SPOR domain-containing protein [Burkholderiaceae bacterium]